MNLRQSEALPRMQVAMSSAQRTRKFREKLKKRKDFSVAERERTRKRVAEIRRREKESKIEEKCDRSCSNPDCRLHKERDRKRKYRDSSAGDNKNRSSGLITLFPLSIFQYWIRSALSSLPCTENKFKALSLEP